MRHSKTTLFTSVSFLIGVLLLAYLFPRLWNVWVWLLLILSLMALFGLFEQRRCRTEKLVLLALLCALAMAGRALFASVPSAQPVTFLVMVSAMAFGLEFGTVYGVLCAMVSNLLLGQGPWTLWQALAWGLVGITAAGLRPLLKKHRLVSWAFGAFWGYLFGWIMNIWVCMADPNPSIQVYLLYCVTSFPHDTYHALTNVGLLVLFQAKFLNLFGRVAQKYGLE